MNYEEKYKQALERVRIEYKNEQSKGNIWTCENLSTIFPELRESEDERIRKEIIAYLDVQDAISNRKDQDFKSWIAWLEKQGEQKPVEWDYPYGENETVDKLMAIAECLEMDEGFLYNGYTGTECVKFLRDLARKQVECKPADKVEPKFKAGDWIVTTVNDDGYIAIERVVEFIGNKVRLCDTDGLYMLCPQSQLNYYRLWTIQDAKAGDVLEFGDHGRLVTGILSFVNKTTGKVDVSCLLEGDKFKVGVFYNLDTVKPHPATKEQRYQLEKAMVDAGYKWNKEEHKLEKNMNNTFLPQTSTWSEEDELMIQDAIYWINEFQKSNKCKDENDMQNSVTCENWLKSIKDRVQPQPKQDWSEEDEHTLEAIIKEIEANKAACPEYDEKAYDMFLSWLKSLKPNHWKPSEEQLNALKQCIGGYYSEKADKKLESLYDELKSL